MIRYFKGLAYFQTLGSKHRAGWLGRAWFSCESKGGVFNILI